MKVLAFIVFSVFATTTVFGQTTPISLSGNHSIRAKFGESDIVIKTTDRLAGAIDGLQWNGVEFIDSYDHGRQMQSASNFDANSRFSGETFNPTEAGSRQDGAGNKSTSRLLHVVVTPKSIQTTSQMAFWLQPGEFSGGHPAKNKTTLSDHLLTKRVRIGFNGLPNVIQYHVTFGVPVGEIHRYAQFEAVTGYMPAVFSSFYALNLETKKRIRLSDGPGEQQHPVILATKDDKYAMGVFSPDQPSKGFDHAGYGRFRFPAQKVVKWNCVFRLRSKTPIKSGDYSFRNYVVIGSLDEVEKTILEVARLTTNRK